MRGQPPPGLPHLAIAAGNPDYAVRAEVAHVAGCADAGFGARYRPDRRLRAPAPCQGGGAGA